MEPYTQEDKFFEECRQRVRLDWMRKKNAEIRGLEEVWQKEIKEHNARIYLNSPDGKEKINQCVRRIFEKAIQPHIMPTKEEQICRTKANSMFTCPPESSSCLGIGRQREEWANNCVRNTVRNPIAPLYKGGTTGADSELKKALPWIIGAGVIILIIYKNK